jgi:hypothetical protein
MPCKEFVYCNTIPMMEEEAALGNCKHHASCSISLS